MKLLILALLAIGLQAQAIKQTITGSFLSGDGTGLNGRITFRLPVATGLNSCDTAIALQANTLITASIVNGVMASTALWPTDCMQPRVPYYVTVYDAFNVQLFADSWYVPRTVNNTIDVGSFIDTKLAPAITVAVPNALNLQPAVSQVLTQPAGTSLTIHGTVIFDPPLSGGGGSSASYYQTILANNVASRQRQFLNFAGAGGVTITQSDNGSDTTTLTFSSAGGGSSSGGTGAGYAFTLNTAISYTILGTTHNLKTADLVVSCNDTSTPAHSFQPVYTINATTFDVTMSLLVSKAGSACFIK